MVQNRAKHHKLTIWFAEVIYICHILFFKEIHQQMKNRKLLKGKKQKEFRKVKTRLTKGNWIYFLTIFGRLSYRFRVPKVWDFGARFFKWCYFRIKSCLCSMDLTFSVSQMIQTEKDAISLSKGIFHFQITSFQTLTWALL